jgi:putative transposase
VAAVAPTRAISVDNGTEFVSKAMDAWAYGRDVRLDVIRPSAAAHSGYD